MDLDGGWSWEGCSRLNLGVCCPVFFFNFSLSLKTYTVRSREGKERLRIQGLAAVSGSLCGTTQLKPGKHLPLGRGEAFDTMSVLKLRTVLLWVPHPLMPDQEDTSAESAAPPGPRGLKATILQGEGVPGLFPLIEHTLHLPSFGAEDKARFLHHLLSISPCRK